LFGEFLKKAGVILHKKYSILGFTHKVIDLQRKLRGLLSQRKAKKRAVTDCLNAYIEQLKAKDLESASKKKKTEPQAKTKRI
jgi:hypothetical protein